MLGKAHLGEALLSLLSKSLGTGFPCDERGKTLLTAADFSGTHSGSLFTSYAFLTIDLDRNGDWFSAQQSFRRQALRKRRMSYKALNDSARRNALPSFLLMSDRLIGALTIVCRVTLGRSCARQKALRMLILTSGSPASVSISSAYPILAA